METTQFAKRLVLVFKQDDSGAYTERKKPHVLCQESGFNTVLFHGLQKYDYVLLAIPQSV
jgi:hypothetical protein